MSPQPRACVNGGCTTHYSGACAPSRQLHRYLARPQPHGLSGHLAARQSVEDNLTGHAGLFCEQRPLSQTHVQRRPPGPTAPAGTLRGLAETNSKQNVF